MHGFVGHIFKQCLYMEYIYGINFLKTIKNKSLFDSEYNSLMYLYKIKLI